MMGSSPLSQPRKPITLIPVGLKEAALDSPTFRSSFTHFVEQFELVEKWLEGYTRCITKLTHEIGAFESLVNGFLAQTPPSHVSEAVLDHDYTLLAMKRYGEGAKEFWTTAISGLKQMETHLVDPIKAFIQSDARSFRESRRNLEQAQRQFDSLQARYSGQGKNKEPSTLREDAFQLHEARKSYLKASMDFSVAAPQLKMALDKLLVRVFSDQWRDTIEPRYDRQSELNKWGKDMERVYCWSRGMENGEKSFKSELQTVRKQLEEEVEAAARPSRNLEDYAANYATVPASRGPSTTNLQNAHSKYRPSKSEKQGWLNLRTVSGKPSRTVWLRRWFYVSNGIFGWLVQGSRSGAVEESDRIGVLLCNVKPSNADERRYVFEIKTKDITIVVQAETQPEITEWLAAFDGAKQKALDHPASIRPTGSGSRNQDPAFAISPPSAPEFAASALDAGSQNVEEASNLLAVDRSSTLPIDSRSSFDVANPRRSVADKDTDGNRDPASRLIQKLDLHRKSATNDRGAVSPGISGSGIASLIAASHTSMPLGPGALATPPVPDITGSRKSSAALPPVRDSTLAPNTLANPPAPTNLSSIAVVVSGERGAGNNRVDSSGIVPSGIMANVWGSTNWSHLNILARGDTRPNNVSSPPARPSIASSAATSVRTDEHSESPAVDIAEEPPRDAIAASTSVHRKTVSLDADGNAGSPLPRYPNDYPLQLKTQDAQFHLFFPDVRRDERVVMVFRATWNPNEQQEFSGRIYVTCKEIYFYSNHCGMTLISSIDLKTISEVTAAKGRESDLVFCHFKDGQSESEYSRITIKTFLEPLNLLQRRLSFLVQNRSSQDLSIEDVLQALTKMEQEDPESGSGMDSWENVSIDTPTDGKAGPLRNLSRRDQRDLRAKVLIDRGLYGESSLQLDGSSETRAFKLPKQPIVYAPTGMTKAVERNFDISPKALFHVMFGDKSAVWQLLYHERNARHIKQGPWNQVHGHLRREFEYQVEYRDWLQRIQQAQVEDHQMIDVANEHLLYVVSDRKRPWHLPHRDKFLLLTKVVITHLAKSKCKLAVYTKVEWTKAPQFAEGIITKAAMNDLELDALDLADVITEQVRTFASAHGRTKKAIEIFGGIGNQSQILEFAGSEAVLKAQLRRSMKPRALTALAFESFASMLESVLTSAGQIIWRFLAWIWNTFSANSIILVVLAMSIVVNIISSSTSTSDWWKERRASRYMAKLGVGSDHIINKAIYFKDFEESTALQMTDSEGTGSHCRDAFDSIMNVANADTVTPPTSLARAPSTRSAAIHRFHRSRQRLGTYRHDLLVAMRVVNSIERELVGAEWENWLVEENMRCKQLGAVIKSNSTDPMMKENRLEKIKIWHEDYCQSCSVEHSVLEQKS